MSGSREHVGVFLAAPEWHVVVSFPLATVREVGDEVARAVGACRAMWLDLDDGAGALLLVPSACSSLRIGAELPVYARALPVVAAGLWQPSAPDTAEELTSAEGAS